MCDPDQENYRTWSRDTKDVPQCRDLNIGKILHFPEWEGWMFKRMQELSKLIYRFMQLPSEVQWDFLKYVWKSYIDESSQELCMKKKV